MTEATFVTVRHLDMEVFFDIRHNDIRHNVTALTDIYSFRFSNFVSGFIDSFSEISYINLSFYFLYQLVDWCSEYRSIGFPT